MVEAPILAHERRVCLSAHHKMRMSGLAQGAGLDRLKTDFAVSPQADTGAAHDMTQSVDELRDLSALLFRA